VNGSSEGIGGLIGYVITPQPLTITNSLNSGNLNGTSRVGGLIGYANSTNLTMSINIGNVNAFGQEFIAKLSFQQSKNISISTNYIGSFINSVDSKTNLQLIFTPRIKHVFNFLLGYKNFFLKYNHTYTGVSYTKSDLSAWNDDFELGNLMLSKQVVFKKLNTIHFQISINNVWNKSYFVMPDRPMPLRNFQFTLQYSITKT
jgi:outer membrane cobalamin receptor